MIVFLKIMNIGNQEIQWKDIFIGDFLDTFQFFSLSKMVIINYMTRSIEAHFLQFDPILGLGFNLNFWLSRFFPSKSGIDGAGFTLEGGLDVITEVGVLIVLGMLC